MQYIKSFLFLLVFSISSLQAQNALERLYTDPNYEYISLDVASLPDGSYFLYSAVKHKDSTDFKRVNLTRLEKKGDFVPGKSWDYYIGDTLQARGIVFPEGSLEIISGDEIMLSFSSKDDDNLAHVILKINFKGEVQWSKATGNTTVANAKNERNKIAYIDSDSLLIHYGSNINNDDPDMYINYYHHSGNLLSNQRYNYPIDTPTNKIYVEQIGSIKQTLHDGGLVFCGMIDTLESDFFITKLDTNKAEQWAIRYMIDTTTHLSGNAVDLIQMNNKYYISAFNQYGSDGKLNGYLSRMDSLGKVQWVQRLSYDQSTSCEITGLVQVDNNSFVLSIKKQNLIQHGKIVMVSFDVDGNKLWEKEYKESYNLPYFEGQLIETSEQKLVYLTTGFDTTSMDSLPYRYLIVANKDGSTECNNDVTDLIIDSVFLYQKEFTWHTFNDVMTEDLTVWTKGRTVIPYTASPLNGRTIYCADEIVDTYLIGTVDGGVSYLWTKSGTQSDSLKIGPKTGREAEGDYIIEATVRDKYCYSLCDTVTLDTFIKSKWIIKPDYSTWCEDRKIKLELELDINEMGVPAGIDSILWSTGDQSNIITVTDSTLVTTYTVTVIDNCGQIATASFTPSEIIPKELNLKIEDNYCIDRTFTISITNIEDFDLNTVVWSTGETTDTILVTPGIYSITALDLCNYEITKEIEVLKSDIKCDDPLQWPNAFIPAENDEQFKINKTFGPFNKGNTLLTDYSLLIINRWGQIVFETKDINTTWNGKYNEKNALGGTYFFKANYTTETDTYEVKGGLVLVR